MTKYLPLVLVRHFKYGNPARLDSDSDLCICDGLVFVRKMAQVRIPGSQPCCAQRCYCNSAISQLVCKLSLSYKNTKWVFS